MAPATQDLEIFSEREEEREEERVSWAGLCFKLSQPTSQEALGSGEGCSESDEVDEVDQLLSVVGAC